MEVVMVLFGIVVLAMGLAVIYNEYQEMQRRDSNADKDKKEK